MYVCSSQLHQSQSQLHQSQFKVNCIKRSSRNDAAEEIL